MNQKQFKLVRTLTMLVVVFVVALAVTVHNMYLALAGVVIGMLFIYLVRKQYKTVTVDERVNHIGGLAGRTAYGVTTLILAVLSMFLVITGSRDADIYVESLGATISFIVLFSIAIYSLAFAYYNKKHGGN